MIAAMIAAAMSMATPNIAHAPSPVRPDARPALWVVNDHDTIIYLFGTFHALDGQTDWFNDEVMTAFAQSDELVLETLVPSPSAPPPVLNGPAGAIGFGAPPSYLSNGRQVMHAGRRLGMATELGADHILRQTAERWGKRVGGLEQFHQQLSMFSRLPGSAEPVDPTQAEAKSQALGAMLAYLQSAWNRGDSERFEPMLDDMRARSPETYQLLFVDRNLRWADWIAQRLQQPGTVFVAVGAGHLAGRDSVQVKLAQAGFRSARIN